MCAAVWVGQGRFLSEETASFSGTPDNFPSEPPARCGESLTKSKRTTFRQISAIYSNELSVTIKVLLRYLYTVVLPPDPFLEFL